MENNFETDLHFRTRYVSQNTQDVFILKVIMPLSWDNGDTSKMKGYKLEFSL